MPRLTDQQRRILRDSYLSTAASTKAHAYRILQNLSAQKGLACPSKATVFRYLRTLEKSLVVTR